MRHTGPKQEYKDYRRALRPEDFVRVGCIYCSRTYTKAMMMSLNDGQVHNAKGLHVCIPCYNKIGIRPKPKKKKTS